MLANTFYYLCVLFLLLLFFPIQCLGRQTPEVYIISTFSLCFFSFVDYFMQQSFPSPFLFFFQQDVFSFFLIGKLQMIQVWKKVEEEVTRVYNKDKFSYLIFYLFFWEVLFVVNLCVLAVPQCYRVS